MSIFPSSNNCWVHILISIPILIPIFFILTWKDFEVFLMVWSTKINTLETTNAIRIKSYPFHSLIIVTDHERLRSLINWFEKRYGRFRKPAMIAHTAKDRWGAHHICR